MAKFRDYLFASIFVSVLLSVAILAVFSTSVFAEGVSPEILTKDDMKGFEKLTFYNNDDINIIGTDPQGTDISPSDTYGFMSRHRLVSTDCGKVEADYGHIGQYHGRDISVNITFSNFEKKPTEDFGERDGRYICVPLCFRDNFQYDGDSVIQKMVFYYSDDESRTPIDMTNAFIVINGLNVDEYAGIASDHQVYISENSQVQEKSVGGFTCYGNGPQGRSDTCITGDDDRKFDINGVYYEEDLSNPLYYICSAMYTLKGTENELYIEDKRKSGGYGIEWSLDLTTLHITYNIKTEVKNGNITDNVSDILYNSDQKISYSPSENYVLDSVTVDGTPIDINTARDEYLFKNITQDHKIAVVYKLPYRKIDTEVVNGSITPSDEQILFGTDKKIEYSAKAGYVLDSISVDGISEDLTRNRNDYSFENVREDHNIKVVYLKPEAPVKKVLDKNGEYIDGKSVEEGDILSYEISYYNNMDKEEDVILTDSIPAFTEFDSATEGGIYENNKVTWKIKVKPLSKGTVGMKVRVKADAKDNVISNYALETIEGMNLMSNTVNNPVQSEPVKKVRDSNGKDINGAIIEKGQEITYSITVRNSSFEEKSLMIKDDIPDGMTFLSADSNGSMKDNTVSWNMMIKSGEEKQVSFKAKANAEGKLYTNQAEVILDGVKMHTNKVENWTLIPPIKEVKQNGISADGKEIQNGEIVTYYITVKNPSKETRDIIVEDKVPDHIEVLNMDNSGENKEGLIKWDLKGVNPGETRVVSFEAKVKGDSDSHKVINKAFMITGDKKIQTNEVSITIPAVNSFKVLGEKKVPFEKQETSENSDVLGEKKIPTGDHSDILALILTAMCAFAGMIIVRMKNE